MARATLRPSPRSAAIVDAVALVAFVLVGTIRHGEGLDLGAIARTGLPLLLAWFLIALAVGTYRRPGWLTLLATWVLAVPIGLVLRSLVRDGPWGHGLLEFGAVAMAFTALFLLAGRALLLVGAMVRHRSEGSPDPASRSEG